MFPDFYFKFTHKYRISSNVVALKAVHIRGWRLKEGGTYFKKRRVIHMKFENFVIISFQITINNNHYGI